MITAPTPLVPPATITAVADHVSSPVAAAIVVGVALAGILVLRLARTIVHKIVGVAAGATGPVGNNGTRSHVEARVLLTVASAAYEIVDGCGGSDESGRHAQGE